MEQGSTQIGTVVLAFAFKVVFAIVIFIVGKVLAKFLSNMTEKLMMKANVEKTLAKFTRNIVYTLLLVFVVIAALNQLGVNTTSLVAVIGAAGLAVGLALQGSLSNFAAGVMIIIFKPFKIGDFIVAADTMGTVKDIQIFNTILAHPDNRKIVVPNNSITAGSIENFSDIEKRRVELVFGISYDDDIKKAKAALKKIVDADERILKDPECLIAVKELGDSSVNIVCRPWVKPSDFWGVFFDLTEQGKLELEKAGCTIPFPQRDVHMYSEK